MAMRAFAALPDDQAPYLTILPPARAAALVLSPAAALGVEGRGAWTLLKYCLDFQCRFRHNSRHASSFS
jgi:hypothetical protein